MIRLQTPELKNPLHSNNNFCTKNRKKYEQKIIPSNKYAEQTTKQVIIWKCEHSRAVVKKNCRVRRTMQCNVSCKTLIASYP